MRVNLGWFVLGCQTEQSCDLNLIESELELLMWPTPTMLRRTEAWQWWLFAAVQLVQFLPLSVSLQNPDFVGRARLRSEVAALKGRLATSERGAHTPAQPQPPRHQRQ